MNLIVVSEKDFIRGGRVKLSGRRFHHIQNVHGAKLGESLRVGLLNDKIGLGEVVGLDNDSVELEIDLNEVAPEPLNTELFMALPRPKNLPRILQTVTTLGVKKIHIFHSYQVDKSFWQSDYLSDSVVTEALWLGLEQARDTVLPRVEFHRYFKPFVEDVAPLLVRNRKAYLAHPCEGEGKVIEKPSTVVIGPEGGLIQYEVDKFLEQGFELLSLGERILKVETALVAALT